MGQHKNNPTAQLAKEGKIPPKPPKMGKREIDRRLYQDIRSYLMYKMPLDLYSAVPLWKRY